MSKTKEKAIDEQNEQEQQAPAESSSPAFIDELLKNGTVTLTAKSADAFGEMIDQIPAEVRYGAGAVGRDYDHGVFTLRIDIIK